jgi:hypothetical protein
MHTIFDIGQSGVNAVCETLHDHTAVVIIICGSVAAILFGTWAWEYHLKRNQVMPSASAPPLKEKMGMEGPRMASHVPHPLTGS